MSLASQVTALADRIADQFNAMRTDVDLLPPGVMLTVEYDAGWAARPTARTDIRVHWIGGTEATPPAGMLTNDLWTRDPA